MAYAWDADRVFYLFAIYLGSSPRIPNVLHQVTVMKTPKHYIVQSKDIRSYYSSKESLLEDWDAIHFV